jgi:hypothetical protein
MKRPITRTLLVTALAALTVTGTASAAEAEPTGCTLRPVTRGAQVSCTGGTGFVRAGVECIVKNEFDNISYGPWVGVGEVSKAVCGGGGRVADYWYDVA